MGLISLLRNYIVTDSNSYISIDMLFRRLALSLYVSPTLSLSSHSLSPPLPISLYPSPLPSLSRNLSLSLYIPLLFDENLCFFAQHSCVCTMCNTQYAVYTVLYAVYTVHCTPYSVHRTVTTYKYLSLCSPMLHSCV